MLRLGRHQFGPWQVLAHVGAWVPLAVLLFDAYTDNLTVNPIQEATFRTGRTALVLLILSLACTPLNSVFGWRTALKLRRPLGLYAFGYVLIHFTIFVWVDYGLDWELLQEAIFEKRYALVGFSALLILLPLALTSTKAWQKRLGRHWKRLHRLVYVAGLLAVTHYVWAVKSDVRIPLAAGAVVIVLLLLRLPAVKRRFDFRQRRARLTRPTPGAPPARPAAEAPAVRPVEVRAEGHD